MKILKKIFPHPWLSTFLFLVWQLIMNDLSFANLLGGLFLAWGIPFITRVFWPDPPVLRRPGVLLRLVLRVLKDIAIANIQVAILILGPVRRLRPAFIEYPLELRDRFAISALASIISLTPGTVSADIRDETHTLLIHGLDVACEQTLIDNIRNRYEKPLKEVFECSNTSS
ncbi:MAG: Na+/H+ antiporter subunit E [Smithellaceae bacterium]